MEPDKKKNRGGFVSPHNLPEEKTDPVALEPKTSQTPGDDTQSPKKTRWVLIVAVILVIVIAVVLLLIRKSPPPPPPTSTQSPAPTEAMYTENGFSISRIEARYIERSLAEIVPNLYDMVFNSGMTDEEAGSIAPAADTSAVSMKTLRLSDLVLAVFYRQNTDLSVSLCKQLEGLPGAPRQKEEIIALPAEGVLYISMDSLVAAEEWTSGNTVLSLMIDGKPALKQPLGIVP